MNKKIIMKLCILFLLVILSFNLVSALGVAPARRSFNFEDGSGSGKITIMNNQHKDVRLAIYAQGDFQDNIKLSKTIVKFSADESSKTISYTLTMPQSPNPGTLKSNIIILELPDQLQQGNSVVTDKGVVVMQDQDEDSLLSATTAVASEIFIEVPYPKKFIDAKFHANTANSNEQLTFTIPLINRGNSGISSVEGEIIIKGPTNEEITRIKTNEISLGKGEDGKLVANWLANVNPGTYFAEAIINFDGEQLVLRSTFVVGDKSLKINDVLIDKFNLGQIAKVDVLISNVWNEMITNVYAELDVLDHTGSTLKKVKTSSVDVPALESETLSGYWDTEGMGVGDYDISVKLFYDDKISEKLFQAIINTDNIQISDTSSISGQVINTKDDDSSMLTILVLAVIVLIILNVFWLLYLKKNKKK
jgi:hypothetical protein